MHLYFSQPTLLHFQIYPSIPLLYSWWSERSLRIADWMLVFGEQVSWTGGEVLRSVKVADWLHLNVEKSRSGPWDLLKNSHQSLDLLKNSHPGRARVTILHLILSVFPSLCLRFFLSYKMCNATTYQLCCQHVNTMFSSFTTLSLYTEKWHGLNFVHVFIWQYFHYLHIYSKVESHSPSSFNIVTR